MALSNANDAPPDVGSILSAHVIGLSKVHETVLLIRAAVTLEKTCDCALYSGLPSSAFVR